MYDSENKELFVCDTESSSLAKQIHIKDMEKKEVAFVSQGSNLLLPEFEITINEQTYHMKREYAPVNPVYTFNKGEYIVEGATGIHRYVIKNRAEEVVGEFTKSVLKVNGVYDIELFKDIDALMAFTMVLAVDCVLTYEILTVI